jgi:hypothetical protein
MAPLKEALKTRPPRGAVIVVVVGLVATVAGGALATSGPVGSAAQLEWIASGPLPDSKPAAIAGGGSMRLSDGEIRLSEGNLAGYRLYRASSVLTIAPDSAVGQGRVRCAMHAPRPPRTLVTHTPGSRAAYPRSTGEGKELLDQGDVPEIVLLDFNVHGDELAAIEFGDVFGAYTTEPGLTVSWGTFKEAVQLWQWSLPKGRPAKPLELGFAAIWRTSTTPSARIACTVQTSDGAATVRTAGRLAVSGKG